MYVFYIMRIYSYKNYVHNCILGHVLISKYINENHPKNQQPSVFLCIYIAQKNWEIIYYCRMH